MLVAGPGRVDQKQSHMLTAHRCINFNCSSCYVFVCPLRMLQIPATGTGVPDTGCAPGLAGERQHSSSHTAGPGEAPPTWPGLYLLRDGWYALTGTARAHLTRMHACMDTQRTQGQIHMCTVDTNIQRHVLPCVPQNRLTQQTNKSIHVLRNLK